MDSSDKGLSRENSNMSMSSMGPQSPLDMKPDTATLLNAGNFSPGPNSPGSLTIGCPTNMISTSPGSQNKTGAGSPYPPNHPLSGSKHLCSICGDRASGKHYGVYSCEGCKGFFKRTVRKDLTYACREERRCLIDKRQRNRCQYCRYQKCLTMGMKREAVQEERQRTKDREREAATTGIGPETVESCTSSSHPDMPVDVIHNTEKRFDFFFGTLNLKHMVALGQRLLHMMVDWAKRIPQFTTLPLDTQILLLRTGWKELLIAPFAFCSIEAGEGILYNPGIVVSENSTEPVNEPGSMYDRILTEVVDKMRSMRLDRAELGCLRAVILYNPEVRGLKTIQEVEQLREKLYASLDEYTRIHYPSEPGRFAKLLLRLPAIRSIGLKMPENLYLFNLLNDVQIDKQFISLMEAPHGDA